MLLEEPKNLLKYLRLPLTSFPNLSKSSGLRLFLQQRPATQPACFCRRLGKCAFIAWLRNNLPISDYAGIPWTEWELLVVRIVHHSNLSVYFDVAPQIFIGFGVITSSSTQPLVTGEVAPKPIAPAESTKYYEIQTGSNEQNDSKIVTFNDLLLRRTRAADATEDDSESTCEYRRCLKKSWRGRVNSVFTPMKDELRSLLFEVIKITASGDFELQKQLKQLVRALFRIKRGQQIYIRSTTTASVFKKYILRAIFRLTVPLMNQDSKLAWLSRPLWRKILDGNAGIRLKSRLWPCMFRTLSCNDRRFILDENQRTIRALALTPKADSVMKAYSLDQNATNRFLNRALRTVGVLHANNLKPRALSAAQSMRQVRELRFDEAQKLTLLIIDLQSCFDFVDGSVFTSWQDAPSLPELSNCNISFYDLNGQLFGTPKLTKLLHWKDPHLNSTIKTARFKYRIPRGAATFIQYRGTGNHYAIRDVLEAASKSVNHLHASCQPACLAKASPHIPEGACRGVPQGHPLSSIACEWYHQPHDQEFISYFSPVAFYRVVDDILVVMRSDRWDVEQITAETARIYRSPVNSKKVQVVPLVTGNYVRWLGSLWCVEKSERAVCLVPYKNGHEC